MKSQQIAEKLTENHRNFTEFILALSAKEYSYSPAGKWNAGEHLDHILRGVSAVETALSLPKFVSGFLFGKADRDSSDYDTLVANYRARLESGGKASGKFIPDKNEIAKREKLVEKLINSVNGLNRKLETYSEGQIDQLLIPHPLIGKLTTREMMYFTIYHVEHHHNAAKENLRTL